MKVELKKPMSVVDFSQSPWRNLMLPPARYELQEIINPATGFAVKWWVLKGKMIGAAIPIWQEHLSGPDGGRRGV